MKKMTIAQPFCVDRRRKMITLVAVAFALAPALSAQAYSVVAPKHEKIVTTAPTPCSAGFHRINAVCVRNTTARAMRRPTVGAGYRH
jgi:hypothetical protein